MAANQYTRTPFLIVTREKRDRKDAYGMIDDAIVRNAQLLRGEHPSDTVLVAMHPVGAPGYLPIFPELARAGHHVIACATRYSSGDAALEMENVILDAAACVDDARQRRGYKNVVLMGWSGGGSLMTGFQAEAEKPVIQQTAAGEHTSLAGAMLTPGDALILVASHRSRHKLLTGQIDPSIHDELHSDLRDPALNLYDPANPSQPPYSREFLEQYRAAQLARNRRISAWAREKLAILKRAGKEHEEFCFTVQGTMADPRWIDPTVDPNQRRPNWTYLGDPRLVNDAPSTLARFSSLRSWLSQWSHDDAQFDSVDAGPRISVPSIVITAGADDACPPAHTDAMFDALGSTDKQKLTINSANHYFSGSEGPAQLSIAVDTVSCWLDERGLANDAVRRRRDPARRSKNVQPWACGQQQT